MNKLCDKFNKKILDNKDRKKFIVFYSKWCPYSMSAINLLKNTKSSYKAYNIDKIKGNIETLLSCLKKKKDITNFDENFSTRPIIFYKGKFIGGYTELKKYIQDF